MAPLVRTGGSRHTGQAALPHRNIQRIHITYLVYTELFTHSNNGSLDICYNVQSAVDAQNHFVIDISTTNDINDQNQLYIMAKDASDLLETEECTVVADTGYYNASEIKNCLDDGMTVLIKKAKANNSTKDNEFRKDKFKYDPEKDVYICPAEQQLYFFENTSKNGMKYK